MAGSRAGPVRLPHGLPGAGTRAAAVDVKSAALAADQQRTLPLRRVFMSISHARAGLFGLAIMFFSFGESAAHEIVGNRFFPATLTIDDPGVNDELAFPTVDAFKTGDVPPIRQRDVSGEISKRITEDFAIALGSTYTFLSPTDPTAPGAN